MTNISLDELLKIGNEWRAGAHHRVYFNDLCGLYGLETSHYGTGNIKSASLNGERISNSKARKLASMLNIGKVWFDVASGEFHSSGLPADVATTIIGAIKRAAQ